MSLRVALVIDGDQSGAKKAAQDTVTDLGKVQEAAGRANGPVEQIPKAFKETAEEADKASNSVEGFGTKAEGASGKISDLKALAIGAVGGIAGALAASALEWATNAALGAVVDYFDEVTNSATNIASDLEAHKTLIGGVKGLWEEADGAASSYGANSKAVLQFEASQNIERLNSDFNSELGRLGGFEYLDNPYRLPSARQSTNGEDHPLRATMIALKADLEDGRADIIAWRDDIVEIANQTELGSSSREVAADFIAKTQTAVELQAELERAVGVFKALNGDADAAATAMGSAAEKMAETGTAASGALPALQSYANLLATISRGGAADFARIPGTGFSAPGGLPGPGYKSGGDTGPGGDDEVAGLVHHNEFVFNAAATARIGVKNLEALHNGALPGYASGGYVGAKTTNTRSTSSATSRNPMDWLLGGFTDLPGLVEGARGSVVGFFKDVLSAQQSGLEGWDAWLDAGANALDSISSKAADMALNGIFDILLGAVTGAFTGGFGGGGLRLGFQAGVGHSGAMIGSASQSRLVDASIFDNAPRHHSGTPALRQGEVPFIGMEGEEIGWPQDLARKYGGGQGNTNYYTIDARGSTLSRAEFEAILDKRDRANAERMPAALAEARYRAVGAS